MEVKYKAIDLEDKRLKGFETTKSFIKDNGWEMYVFKDMKAYKEQIKEEKERYTLKSLEESERNIVFWYDEYSVNIIEIGDKIYVELLELEEVDEEEENKLSPFTDEDLIKELAKRQKQFATYELAERYVDDINEILWPLIDVKEEDE